MIYKTLAFLTLSAFALPSYALRCGIHLVQTGNHKADVTEKCGDPISHEEIGYIDKITENSRITVLKIEESVYRINGRRYYFVYEGNKLTEINSSSK